MLPKESQAELLKKHRACAVDLGGSAVLSCLRSANATTADVSFLCCVTTTGFLSPGVSAYLCRALDLSPSCARLDVVGMGCNGGLNALNVTASWAKANPGKLAVMLCVEICSAGYVIDETARTAVVNGLFGDGAAAVALLASDEDGAAPGPAILKFHGRIISEAIDAMRYDWDESRGKFSFFLDPQIPYVVGANVERTIDGLLSHTGLRRSNIAHQVVHAGGKKVIDAIRIDLGLSRHDLRHTISVLRERISLDDLESSESGQLQLLHRRLAEERVIGGFSTPDVPRGPLRTFAAALRARYRPEKPYWGRTTLITVDDPKLDAHANRLKNSRLASAWKVLAPRLAVAHAPGNHMTVLKPPHAAVLSKLIGTKRSASR